MNKSAFLGIALLAAGYLLFPSCQKQPDPQPAPQPIDTPIVVDSIGMLSFEITHAVGNLPLELNSTWYVTENGDSLQVTNYKYFISNIKLEKADGTIWAQPESYYLIDEASASSKKFDIPDVPAGTYIKLHFMVGVDSTRNVSGAQTGALDPASGMFWTWNSGYIMAKVEGLSPQANNPQHLISYHCGGFTGRNSGVRKYSFELPESITTGNPHHPEIHLRNDLLEWFKTPNTIKFSELSTSMNPAETGKLADNYRDMFTIDHVHNE